MSSQPGSNLGCGAIQGASKPEQGGLTAAWGCVLSFSLSGKGGVVQASASNPRVNEVCAGQPSCCYCQPAIMPSPGAYIWCGKGQFIGFFQLSL